MRRLLLLAAFGTCACDRAPQRDTAAPATAAPLEVPATNASQSKAVVLPMPKDQTELDRLILAGYTPHGNHLHPPGVKNCPLVQEGNDAVM